MSGFLSTAHPRLRVLGGTRFITVQEPQPEWADFGSYCFMLPRSALILMQCGKTSKIAHCSICGIRSSSAFSSNVEVPVAAYRVC